MTKLASQLHSVLFINPSGIDSLELSKTFGATEAQLGLAAAELEKYLVGSGLVLLREQGRLQLAANTDILPSDIVKELQSEQLSPVALEVLTIVAYHQPIAQGEIENMRGVGSEQTLKSLVEKGLLSTKSKKVDGLSVPHYRTTITFLASLGITSLDKLPSLEDKTELTLKDGILNATK